MINTKNSWLWFGGIWLSVGAVFFVVGSSVGVYQSMLSDRLDKKGRTVDGVVLTKEISTTSTKSGTRSSTSYRVTFRFVPRVGEAVRGTADLTKEEWDALEERGPIQVTYLPDQPESYRVPGQSKEIILPLIFGGVGAVVGSIGGFIVFNAAGTRRREKELSRTGMIADATITDIGPSYLRINGVSQIKLRYRFQDAQGKTREGSCTMSPEEAGNWPPGHTGRVRYDPRKPTVSVWIGRD
jgi:hypothetical protein